MPTQTTDSAETPQPLDKNSEMAAKERRERKEKKHKFFMAIKKTLRSLRSFAAIDSRKRN